MFYIKETDNELIKYEVKLDTERLINLREKIVNNCSKIIHHKYQCESESDFNISEDINIKNYRSRKVEEPKDYFETYEIEYDEYMPTPLVEYIVKLLNGDAQAINQLKTYQPSYHPIIQLRYYEKELKGSLIEDLENPLEKIEINALRQRINSLEDLKENIEININQVSESTYYDDVMQCITLTEVDRIDKDAIRRVEEFQGISYTKKNKH